jgi:uncharacterized integral membrane protein
MEKNKDKKILWSMGIVAICLIFLVVSFVVFSNVDEMGTWRVLLPLGIALGGITISCTLLLCILKFGGKKEMKRR